MTATIDMTAISARHTSPEARTRVGRRHGAEFRLKAYGILAILLAAASLVVLVSTIARNAATVVYESYLEIETVIEVSDRDLERLKNPDPRSRAALNDSWRNGLVDSVVDGEELSRRETGALFALVSRDAGLELGDIVKQDLTLIGETYQFEALLDDQVQMFRQGAFGDIVDAGSQGTLRIEPLEGVENGVALRFAPQAMTEARLLLRETRGEQARAQRRQADRQEAAVQAMEEQIAAAREAGEPVEELQSRREGYIAERDRLIAEANRLLQQVTPGAVYELSTADPSVLIRVNGGWIKLDTLTQERGTGVIMERLSSFDAADEDTWRADLVERPETARNINDMQVIWLSDFERQGRIVERFNWRLLTSSDSSNAELAGIWGALVGSFWTMIVTFLLAFPVGVMASIYLEEFAPKNRLTDFIEININNLAAVPSIVFGLLGITVLISGVQLFGVELFDGLLRSITEDPRSTPLAGGVVLALMSLPTIIIAARASIKAVPPSIRDAALGIGASKLQTATHHVLPLAMPGILTGTIIALAQALGETAPLIIIGMNSFIQEAPGTPLDKGNVLPSLIYLWNNNSERLFDGKTAMAITVLLIFLIAMNGLAVLLRKQFERRW